MKITMVVGCHRTGRERLNMHLESESEPGLVPFLASFVGLTLRPSEQVLPVPGQFGTTSHAAGCNCLRFLKRLPSVDRHRQIGTSARVFDPEKPHYTQVVNGNGWGCDSWRGPVGEFARLISHASDFVTHPRA